MNPFIASPNNLPPNISFIITKFYSKKGCNSSLLVFFPFLQQQQRRAMKRKITTTTIAAQITRTQRPATTIKLIQTPKIGSLRTGALLPFPFSKRALAGTTVPGTGHASFSGLAPQAVRVSDALLARVQGLVGASFRVLGTERVMEILTIWDTADLFGLN